MNEKSQIELNEFLDAIKPIVKFITIGSSNQGNLIFIWLKSMSKIQLGICLDTENFTIAAFKDVPELTFIGIDELLDESDFEISDYLIFNLELLKKFSSMNWIHASS